MLNPRLVAEDITQYYISRLDPGIPHKKNVKKYLRKPILALTRRLFLQKEYDNLSQNKYTGNEKFGDSTDIDFAKAKEGLDWRNYTDAPLVEENELDQSFVASETETESEEMKTENPSALHAKGNIKLSRRTLARMESFLASCILSLPSDVGISQSKSTSSSTSNHNLRNPILSPVLNKIVSSVPIITAITKRRSSSNSSMSRRTLNETHSNRNGTDIKATAASVRYPQMHPDDLIVRIELYIRTLRRVCAATNSSDSNEQRDECVIHLEPQRAMQTRIYNMIDSLLSTTSSVGSMSFTLTNLLIHFTREMLAVEILSGALLGKIQKIVQEYEHQTSFASLAFLSSPEDTAETHLAPLLFAYVDMLTKTRESLVWECRLEGTLARAIDPTLRKIFKNTEFQSIGHLLDVCNEFEMQLNHIVITSKESPLHMGENRSIHDILASPSFDVNIAELCGSKSAVKQAFRDLRRESIVINGHVLPPVKTLSELVKLLSERLNSRPVKLRQSKIGNVYAEKKYDSSSGTESEIDYSDHSLSNTNVEDSDPMNLGVEGDSDLSSSDMPKRLQPMGTSKKDGRRRRVFNVDAIDILIRRLLLAASRTRAGGDAYFVVRDLFGGEGLEVIQENHRIDHSGIYSNGKLSPTIEVSVKLASVTLKCHTKFNVYPENRVEECEPFIELHTTISETIELQEIRIMDDQKNDAPKSDVLTKAVLIEKTTENSGRRILSIKPATYEKIKDLRTPS